MEESREEARAVVEKAREEARAAAAAAREEAEARAALLDAVASVSSALGDSQLNGNVAYHAAYDAAYDAAEKAYDHGYSQNRSRSIANQAAIDAAYPAQAALTARLDEIAGQAGLDSDVSADHEAAATAWIEAWTLAEDPDRYWGRSWISSLTHVFDRQQTYDDLAYRAAARAVRTAVATSVPSSDSVAAAEAEDLHWAEDGTARKAFEAARDRIASARAGYRGLIHPGTDGIAWNAYRVALDVLESSALAEAADIRATAATDLTGEIDDTDGGFSDLMGAAESEFENAQAAVQAAEAELRDARTALDGTRPHFDRAVRAAWSAVAEEAGCA